MLFRSALFVCLVSAVVATPRAVPNPKTPNQIVDKVVEDTLAQFEAKGWTTKKHARKGEYEFEMTATTTDSTYEDFKISRVSIYGLGSITRSKSATFNSDESELMGAIKFSDLTVTVNYELIYDGAKDTDGVKQGGQDVTGSITEQVSNAFVHFTMPMKKGLPRTITDVTTSYGQNRITEVTGLKNTDKMGKLDKAGMRTDLLNVFEFALTKNVPNIMRKSIRAWRAAEEV